MKIATFILGFFCLIQHLGAVDLSGAYPFISGYNEKDHKVSNNNHAVVQDARGLLYFANDYGILEFDGNDWNIIQVPANRSHIRSLAFGPGNRLYVGAQGDFGFIDFSSDYGLIFRSLADKVPDEYKSFGDVVNTFAHKSSIVFQSWDGLYIYDDQGMKVVRLQGGVLGAFQVGNALLAHGEGGLYELSGEVLKYVPGTDFFDKKGVSFILPIKSDEWVIGTYGHGMYRWINGQIMPFELTPNINFSKERITAGRLNHAGHLVVGTATNGVYVIDYNGNVINHLNKKKGLSDDEVKTVYVDQSENLWVCTKRGIDYVETASPFTRLVPDSEKPTEVYDACIHNQRLYLATHDGLLSAKVSELNSVTSEVPLFTKVEGSNETNWSLNLLGNDLLVGHNNGFTQLVNSKAVAEIKVLGGWKIVPLPQDSTLYIGGTYKGIVIIKKVNGVYEFVNEVEGFSESSRVIEVDAQGYIWIAHGYKGIYRLKLNQALNGLSDLRFYDSRKGLPTNYYNSVSNLHGAIIFGTENGIYRFHESSDTIILDTQLTRDTWGFRVGRLLKEDQFGNLWFIGMDQSGVLKFHPNGQKSKELLPFVKLADLYLPGFVSFNVVDDATILIGGNNGAVVYASKKKHISNQSFQVFLRSVSALGPDEKVIYSDRFEFLCDTLSAEAVTLPFQLNSLRFTFATAFYENINHIAYQYYLEGFDDDWSAWQSVPFKDYTNLPPGNYVFRIKARNAFGVHSNEGVYRFTITPPWFRSPLAYAMYLLLAMGLLYLLMRVRTVRLKRMGDRAIREQHRVMELEKSRLLEVQLQKDLHAKNQELSGLAMQVIYKNEKLNELKEKLSVAEGLASEVVAKKINDVMKFIDKELNEDNWEDFEMRFDLAHNDFIKRLKQAYPELTSKDLKMCAYLRMNLSTKEMAQLLNMTVRGVETARYRIRKRMNLETTDNLTDFILTY